MTRAMGRSQAVKARGFDSRMRRFESCRPSQCDPVAQLVEHLTFNQRVRSSSLRWVTSFSRGRGGMADAPDLGSGVPGTYEFESLRPHQRTACTGLKGRNPSKVDGVCGCNSMAERQPSKLDTWVRFPSPAPFFSPRVLAKLGDM